MDKLTDFSSFVQRIDIYYNLFPGASIRCPLFRLQVLEEI